MVAGMGGQLTSQLQLLPPLGSARDSHLLLVVDRKCKQTVAIYTSGDAMSALLLLCCCLKSAVLHLSCDSAVQNQHS